MEFRKGPLFPTTVYQFETDLRLKALAAQLLGIREKDAKGHTRSNAGPSWHSRTDIFQIEELAELVQTIIEAGSQVLIDGRACGRVQLEEMWANVLDLGGYHNPHTHGHGNMSGVLHVTAPEGSPPVTFLSPNPSVDRICHPIPAVAGQMLIFPSWLAHYVEPHRGKAPRISVSFNLRHITTPKAVPKTHPPFVRIPKLLDRDDLVRLSAQLASANWNPGAVGDGGKGSVKTDVRDNAVFFADFAEVSSPYHWLFQKIVKAAHTVNDEQYKVDISGGAQPVQFCRYGPGQEYKPHTDSSPDPNAATHSRSLSVAITICAAAKGGGTSFTRADDQPVCEPGDAVFFRSDEEHAALPVIEGIRETAIVWFQKPGDSV